MRSRWPPNSGRQWVAEVMSNGKVTKALDWFFTGRRDRLPGKGEQKIGGVGK